jgi:hypothetical protein
MNIYVANDRFPKSGFAKVSNFKRALPQGRFENRHSLLGHFLHALLRKAKNALISQRRSPFGIPLTDTFVSWRASTRHPLKNEY